MQDNKNITLQLGSVINGKWIIVEFIAKGGMGEIYRAHQFDLKRDVAIKIISREWIESLNEDPEELLNGLQRFKNEVLAMAQVTHPNILKIFDYGSFSVNGPEHNASIEYIVMEYVPGGTLRSTMSEDGFYPEEDLVRDWINEYFLPVLKGVEALHKAGIIHRDIKPENVLLDKNIPKIADFGLAHSCYLQPITQSADMKGTPAYMPPEQFMDFRRTDERTDIYALGKILYEAIAGKIQSNVIPFKQARLKEAESRFFKWLDDVIQKATSEEKAERFSSIKEFQEVLQKGLDISKVVQDKQGKDEKTISTQSRPLNLMRWLWPSLIIIVLCIAGGLLWFFINYDKPLFQIHNLSKPAGIEKITTQNRGDIKKLKPSGILSSDIAPKTLQAKDGATLYLIRGGVFIVPDGFGPKAGTKLKMQSFYMDETLVTNHQYVNFLNQVLDQITVEKDVVKSNGDIWLFLGEALEGYRPVVYRNGRFQVNNPVHASCPVIRVSPYGASAYAKFYGKRLISALEWAYTFSKGGTTEKSMNDARMDEPLHFPHPTLNYPPNRFGIRGLGANISEWGIISTGEKISGQSSIIYVILGGLGSPHKSETAICIPVPRKPWEAFEEVGFRTAMDPPM